MYDNSMTIYYKNRLVVRRMSHATNQMSAITWFLFTHFETAELVMPPSSPTAVPKSPLIPEKYLDVPSQRLYYLSLGLLCQVSSIPVLSSTPLPDQSIRLVNKNSRFLLETCSRARWSCDMSKMVVIWLLLLHFAFAAANTEAQLQQSERFTTNIVSMAFG